MIQKSILFLAAVLLLSACSSNFSLMKRRYTKGYYIASSKNASTPKRELESKKALVKAVADQPETIIVKAPAEEAVATVIAPSNTRANTQTRAAASKKAGSRALAVSPKEELQKKTESIQPIRQKAAKETKNTAAATDSNTKLIIMVILCFFWWLNLISVYMHDNDITLNFWITLLLDLTFIGGIIFSLLVVLDVVDLR